MRMELIQDFSSNAAAVFRPEAPCRLPPKRPNLSMDEDTDRRQRRRCPHRPIKGDIEGPRHPSISLPTVAMAASPPQASFPAPTLPASELSRPAKPGLPRTFANMVHRQQVHASHAKASPLSKKLFPPKFNMSRARPSAANTDTEAMVALHRNALAPKSTSTSPNALNLHRRRPGAATAVLPPLR